MYYVYIQGRNQGSEGGVMRLFLSGHKFPCNTFLNYTNTMHLQSGCPILEVPTTHQIMKFTISGIRTSCLQFRGNAFTI